MSDLQQPLTGNENQQQQHEQQYPPQQYQQQQYPPQQQQYPPQQQQYDPQQQQYINQQQQQQYLPSEYQQHQYQQPQQHQDRPNMPSEFRQSQNQPIDEEMNYPSRNDGVSDIENIDQWVRIVPCVLLGLSTIIISSVFLAKCTLTQPSVYITSGACLLILPFMVFKYDVKSKFMNFVASLISFYFMVVLAVYTNSQKGVNTDDLTFYNETCFKKGATEVFKGISYGLLNLLGLSMCLLHTINATYYFCQVWILSKHNLKNKIEHYAIELI